MERFREGDPVKVGCSRSGSAWVSRGNSSQFRLLHKVQTEHLNSIKSYGQSTKPVGLDSRGHSKREWAKDIIHVVNSLWGEQKPIIAYGHDRGARLSYRLALDFPTRVVGAGLLDIVPTSYVWNSMNLENKHDETKRSHHWVCISHRVRPVDPRRQHVFTGTCIDIFVITKASTRDDDNVQPGILLPVYDFRVGRKTVTGSGKEVGMGAREHCTLPRCPAWEGQDYGRM